ncbi:glucose-6-phosphate isomerase [bacterium]|nr:MAG: glucose-6-phosphate isomerase [bacterium]
MRDLREASGLPIALNTQKNRLVLGAGLTKVTPAVRYLKEMREVLVSKDTSSPRELYYMYRGLRKIKDETAIRGNKLRYDVTIIRHERLGPEFMKTAGHYHPGCFGELYEVLSGEGWCLLQKKNSRNFRIIEDVILVKARAGDKIVIPPYYGHILINIGKECLVTSNWVSGEFASEYELYKKSGGAAYFVLEDKLGERFEVNAYYQSVPRIRVAKPARKIAKFGLKAGEPMYPLLYKDVQKLDFLNNPLKYDYRDVFVFL